MRRSSGITQEAQHLANAHVKYAAIIDIAALRIGNCGRANSDAMGRSRKKKLEDMTELERLQQEVKGFSTEDVLLKK